MLAVKNLYTHIKQKELETQIEVQLSTENNL